MFSDSLSLYRGHKHEQEQQRFKRAHTLLFTAYYLKSSRLGYHYGLSSSFISKLYSLLPDAVAMVTDVWRHHMYMIREQHDIQCMPGFPQITNKTLPAIYGAT